MVKVKLNVFEILSIVHFFVPHCLQQLLLVFLDQFWLIIEHGHRLEETTLTYEAYFCVEKNSFIFLANVLKHVSQVTVSLSDFLFFLDPIVLLPWHETPHLLALVAYLSRRRNTITMAYVFAVLTGHFLVFFC